jgi:NCS1 family nucleobase:cation symporter-1
MAVASLNEIPTVTVGAESVRFSWLVGYSGFLGPIAGILICDYFVVRRKIIVVEDLYRHGGCYEYSSGFNWRAMAALAAGAGVAFVGLVYPPLRIFYDYAWFVGLFVSFVVYYVLRGGSVHDTVAAS